MLRFLAAVVSIGAALGYPSGASSQSREIYEAYNIYRTVPATSQAQLGAMNEGVFDGDGVTLRLGQLVCKPSPLPTPPNGETTQCAPQAGITAKRASASQFAFVAAFKAIFGLDVSAQKFSVSQINITNACITELSLEDAMTAINRPSCLRAIQTARRGYSKTPLRQRLSQPGEWLLMFQTTRLMKADVQYTLMVKEGISIDAGLKDLAIRTVGQISNASAVISHVSNREIIVKATSAYIAVRPRYYEELYLPEPEAAKVRQGIETLARHSAGDRGDDAEPPAVAFEAIGLDPTIKAVESAGQAADAQLKRQLEALQ